MTRRNMILSFLMIFMAAGCSRLIVRQPITAGDHDWMMYGGNVGRTNVAEDMVSPPLQFKWQFDASAGFSPTAASVLGNILCVGNLRGEVFLIDITSGEAIGSRKFGNAIIGTPIVEDNNLYIALPREKESLLAYDLRMASSTWSISPGIIESSPLVIDGQVIVTTLDGKLVSVNKKNGAVLWIFAPPIHPGNRLTHSSPASDGTIVVFGNDAGDLYGVDLSDGRLRWQSRVRGGILATPTIRDGRILFGSLDSTFYSFDAATGKELWAQPVGVKITSPQSVTGKYLYFGTVTREVCCLHVHDGTVVWKTTLGGMINSAPVVSGGTLYVGCYDKKIYALDAEAGGVLWQYETEGRIKTAPVISGNLLFVFSDDRTVLAFQTSGAK